VVPTLPKNKQLILEVD